MYSIIVVHCRVLSTILCLRVMRRVFVWYGRKVGEAR